LTSKKTRVIEHGTMPDLMVYDRKRELLVVD